MSLPRKDSILTICITIVNCVQYKNLIVQQIDMGRSKKRKFREKYGKVKGKRPKPIVFSDTTRFQRMKRTLEHGREMVERSQIDMHSMSDVDYKGLAAELQGHIKNYKPEGWAEPLGYNEFRLPISPLDAKDILESYRKGNLAKDLMSYKGRQSGRVGKFNNKYVIEATVDFFKQSKHESYIEKEKKS